MGKADKERLHQALNLHLNNIHETFQELDRTPASSLDKVNWDEVIKMGEQLSKQATVAGMLWTGENPGVKALEENMQSYFNILQGVLLLAYGSTVGAGPTLSSNIHASIKRLVDCSFTLWKDSVSSYGSRDVDPKLTIPQLVGTVWDACSALKKTPSNNVTAVGRAMTQVAVSIKDVVRELKELRPSSSASTDESSSKEEAEDDGDDSNDDDIGNDLSVEEMKIAQLATSAVSELLVVVKELIRSITSLLKHDKLGEKSGVQSLEKLLELSRGAGVFVDELGACLYPPQEESGIMAASKGIRRVVDEMQQELNNLNGSTAAFSKTCCSLKSALDVLDSGVASNLDMASEAIEPCSTNAATFCAKVNHV